MTFEEAILHIVKEEAKGYGIEEGLERGHLERNTAIVQNLLRKTKFTDTEIAELVDVSIEFVKEIKSTL